MTPPPATGPASLGLALVAALVLHGAALAVVPWRETPQLPPSGGGEIALLGNGFEDFVTGTSAPVPPQPVPAVATSAVATAAADARAQERPVAPREPLDPVPAATSATSPAADPPVPVQAEAARTHSSDHAAPVPVSPTPVEATGPDRVPAETPPVAAGQLPVSLHESPIAMPATTPLPSQPTDGPLAAEAPRGETRALRAIAPGTVETALPDTEPVTSVHVAARPPARPDERVPEDMLAPAAPPPRQAPAPQPPAPTTPPSRPRVGTGATDATRGTQVGQAEGTAPAEGRGEAPAAPGAAAAVANYPGVVMRRLMSTRRDRVAASGTAVISFTVGGSGALAALGVATGSGNPGIDRAGLALVQRAAPFPAPPSGAQVSFSFRFTGG